MCNNQECMNADYCRRQTDGRKKRQQFKYFLNQGDKCDHFIPNDKYETFAILSGKGQLIPPGVYVSEVGISQSMGRDRI